MFEYAVKHKGQGDSKMRPRLEDGTVSIVKSASDRYYRIYFTANDWESLFNKAYAILVSKDENKMYLEPTKLIKYGYKVGHYKERVCKMQLPAMFNSYFKQYKARGKHKLKYDTEQDLHYVEF